MVTLLPPPELEADLTQIRHYRSRHKIRPLAMFGAPNLVCLTDGLKILPRRGAAGRQLWRHDPDEVTRLANRTVGYQ